MSVEVGVISFQCHSFVSWNGAATLWSQLVVKGVPPNTTEWILQFCRIKYELTTGLIQNIYQNIIDWAIAAFSLQINESRINQKEPKLHFRSSIKLFKLTFLTVDARPAMKTVAHIVTIICGLAGATILARITFTRTRSYKNHHDHILPNTEKPLAHQPPNRQTDDQYANNIILFKTQHN